VHTTFSTDAFQGSLPMMQGEGAHPPADACDFARFCSALDFWSLNDHAEGLTPRRWGEMKETLRQCNAVAGDPKNPDVVAFLGWEWTQVGATPETHWGHQNVIFRDLGDEQVPKRPIAATGYVRQALSNIPLRTRLSLPVLDFSNRQRYFDFDRFAREMADVPECPEGVHVRELPEDCGESAATPGDLNEKLTQWGFDTIVIPHGTTWGMYSPPGVTWDKHLTTEQHDAEKQRLIEIFSGHGNSEEYRDWRAVTARRDGTFTCPEPSENYLPSCWRAGEIIRERCEAAGRSDLECRRRTAEARNNAANSGVAGWHTVPGARAQDWLDSGQCQDCTLPAFNYRPGSSVQYTLAIQNFDDPDDPKRFRFGFIASSDNHTARPGTGYKEVARGSMSDNRGPRDEAWYKRLSVDTGEPVPESVPFVLETTTFRGFQLVERERQASFFLTGGLVAAHSEGRSREAVWDAMKRKEVYGTSGERILLWFDLINAPSPGGDLRLPMGSEAEMNTNPKFVVRAVGAFRQKPGCPQYSLQSLPPEEIERLCRGECYNPSDERKLITRIEVVRIRPQSHPGEPVGELIDDPWRTFRCPPNPDGCAIAFVDPEFNATGRDTVYYARAVEEPSPAINARSLRCEYDEAGRCVRVDPCWGDYRTDLSDECLAPHEARAWSSPIYVDFRKSPVLPASAAALPEREQP
jgi:hypothetical protein